MVVAGMVPAFKWIHSVKRQQANGEWRCPIFQRKEKEDQQFEIT
jgi:uncharacterized membrane protein YesL